MNILKKFIKPKSAIDIGCGDGIWIKSIKEKFNLNGVGLESEKSVKFYTNRINILDPVTLKRKFQSTEFFDLLVCIEVASDLNEKRANSLFTIFVS